MSNTAHATAKGGRRLTGGVVMLMLGGFFLVMFGANGALIYTALSTLHGEEVENSYDASQGYNKRLLDAAAQDALGWKVDVTARPESEGVMIVADFRGSDGAAIPGLEVRARFIHPFDRGADREAVLASEGGAYEGAAPLANGWPRTTKFPDLLQRKAIQEALIRLGYLQGPADGLIGPASQAAYAKFQASRGEVADGFITAESYDELAAAATP